MLKLETAFHQRTTQTEFVKLSDTDNDLLLEPEEPFKCADRGQNTAMKASEAAGRRTFGKTGSKPLLNYATEPPSNNQQQREKRERVPASQWSLKAIPGCVSPGSRRSEQLGSG